MATSVRFVCVTLGALLCLAWGMAAVASAQSPYGPYPGYPDNPGLGLRHLRLRLELGLNDGRGLPLNPAPLPYDPRYDFRRDREREWERRYDFRLDLDRPPSPYPLPYMPPIGDYRGDPYRDPRCPICPPYAQPRGPSPYAQPYGAPPYGPISQGTPQGYQQYSTRPGSRFTPAIVPVPGARPPQVTESRSRP